MRRRAFLRAIGLGLPALAARRGGAMVVGSLYRVGPRGETYPAQGIPVRVLHPSYGPSSFAYSDGRGGYALYNIPPADYVLQIWSSPQAIQQLAIRVPPQERVNIPPIQVP